MLDDKKNVLNFCIFNKVVVLFGDCFSVLKVWIVYLIILYILYDNVLINVECLFIYDNVSVMCDLFGCLFVVIDSFVLVDSIGVVYNMLGL